MLIRIDRRHDGVKAYLEHGQKKGRDQSRDELDERVVLLGDLDFADAVIQSIDAEPNVSRYVTVTLSFKEDEVDIGTMRAVAEEFEAFVFSAYRPDEYVVYAEAHLPKVKSYVDQKTGLLVERKPHIHMVLPKMNLISGGSSEPLGYVISNIPYIDAIQEHLNAKYGLASPKDNRRVALTDGSEMIGRYKGDLFTVHHRALKEQILDAVLDRKIERYDDFMAMLAEHGQVRTRNVGREDAYLNVKALGADKGVNLKDFVFSRAFVEASTADKLRQLGADIKPVYEDSGAAREAAPEIPTLLAEWHATRAREIKYLNSGNKRAYDAYQEASPQDRERTLAALERSFYAKHKELYDESGSAAREFAERERRLRRMGRVYAFKSGPGGRADGPAPAPRYAGKPDRTGRSAGVPDAARFGRELAGGGQHPSLGPGATRSLASTPTLNSVPTLSGCPVARVAQPGAVLLPDHAPHQLEHGGAESADALRRPGDREPGGVAPSVAPLRPTGRVADSVISQLMRDAREAKAQQLASADPDLVAMRRSLDARRLLAELSHSHGVLPDKYSIWKGRDGADRIRCGKRSYNVADFLTKELKLPWRDAAQILRDAHGRQAGRAKVLAPRALPQPALWGEYMAARLVRAHARSDTSKGLLDAQRTRRAAILSEFAATRDRIKADPSLSGSGRRAALSVARMKRLQALHDATTASRAERAALASRYRPQTFAQFLQERAQAGDGQALAELQRTYVPAAAKRDGNWISGIEPEANAIVFHAPAVTYAVASNGDVTYRHDGRDVVRDQGTAVKVLALDRAAIELGLRLAQAKFGGTLELAGSPAYQLEAARIAAEAGLAVRFSEPTLNDAMDACRIELVAARVDALARRAAPPAKTPSVPAAPAVSRDADSAAPSPDPDAP
ncbi:LPD7 domain-containing protein [Cupriavidus sp. CP313]